MKRSDVDEHDYWHKYKRIGNDPKHSWLRVGDKTIRLHYSSIKKWCESITSMCVLSYCGDCMAVERFVADHWTQGGPPQYDRSPFCPEGNRCAECELEVWHGEPNGDHMVWRQTEVVALRDVMFHHSIHADDSICHALFQFTACSSDIRQGDLSFSTNLLKEEGQEDRVELPTKEHRESARKLDPDSPNVFDDSKGIPKL